MLWMRVALVSEGASDDAFLPAVLQRSAEDVCPVGTQVDDVLPVRAARGPASVADMVRALAQHRGGFGVIAVHHDGASDPRDVYRRWVVRLHDLWLAAGFTEPVVGVVPVRETEAWALADAEALRFLLGWSSSSTLGLPERGVELEKLTDPKAALRALFERQHRWNPQYLTRLSQLASLERLRELPSFRRWEDDLAGALQALPGFTKKMPGSTKG